MVEADVAAATAAAIAAAAAAATGDAAGTYCSGASGSRKKPRVDKGQPKPAAKAAPPPKLTVAQRKVAADKRKDDQAAAAAALPVWFVHKEGRLQIRRAVSDMVLTTDFGKKYKCLFVYRCVRMHVCSFVSMRSWVCIYDADKPICI